LAFPSSAAFPFRFAVDGTKAETERWMSVRFGVRDEINRISAESGFVATGETANVTTRPPISLTGSGSSGLIVPVPFFTFFLLRTPFEKCWPPFWSGEAGESIRKSGTGLDDPFVPVPAACPANMAIGNADLETKIKWINYQMYANNAKYSTNCESSKYSQKHNYLILYES
jgi:hypothetical protein